jgi:hypothetical protein
MSRATKDRNRRMLRTRDTMDLAFAQPLDAASLRGAAMEWPAIVELAGTWAAALGIEALDGQ